MTVWHLDPEAIRRYAQGAAPPDLAASAEAHLMKCAVCRGVISSYVDAQRAEAIWHEVVDRVDAPRRSGPERMLVRLGSASARRRHASWPRHRHCGGRGCWPSRVYSRSRFGRLRSMSVSY